MRLDQFEAERMGTELMRVARRAYESEITIQAARVGCGRRAGRLTNGAILRELSDQGKEWSTSIVNTYNYDLAVAIQAIKTETPAANRNVYAARLRSWEARRSAWKTPQIAQMAEGWARSKAQKDFADNNRTEGSAVLKPETAVCPICAGWIKRGRTELQIALNNPGPFHPFCPHLWQIDYNKFSDDECRLLWLGE